MGTRAGAKVGAKKTRRLAFGTWLLRQRRNPSYFIRDLASEYGYDPCKPRRATVERFLEHLNYHHNHLDEVVEDAFHRAARAYRRYLKISY